MKAVVYLLLVLCIVCSRAGAQDNSTSLPAETKPANATQASPVLASDAAKPAAQGENSEVPAFAGNYPQKEGSFGWLVGFKVIRVLERWSLDR